MKKKKIVYIVKEEEISDEPCIIAVFSTKKKAEKFIQEYEPTAEIEEYEVDPPEESIWCVGVVQICSSSSGTYSYLKKE